MPTARENLVISHEMLAFHHARAQKTDANLCQNCIKQIMSQLTYRWRGTRTYTDIRIHDQHILAKAVSCFRKDPRGLENSTYRAAAITPQNPTCISQVLGVMRRTAHTYTRTNHSRQIGKESVPSAVCCLIFIICAYHACVHKRVDIHMVAIAKCMYLSWCNVRSTSQHKFTETQHTYTCV